MEGDSSYLICECGEPLWNHKLRWEQYLGSRGQVLYGCAESHCSVFSAARNRHNEELYLSGQRLLWR